MKTTKTLFITLICSFIFSLTTPSSIAFANHTLITSNVYAASTDATPPEISPASHTIVWKYKTLNGVLYKCRYNQTTRKWIGKWIPILYSLWMCLKIICIKFFSPLEFFHIMSGTFRVR
mgnify:FL=1